jgi:GNAT superfamily N-acetyltransferase
MLPFWNLRPCFLRMKMAESACCPNAYITAFEATWPALRCDPVGPFIYRDGAGGGSRTSAATLDGNFSTGDVSADALDQIEARFAADARPALFQIRTGEAAFDALLIERGYTMFDPTLCLAAPIEAFAPSDPKCSYVSWPPVSIQREIWAEGGIGPARLAVMDRACAPKTSLLGRIKDRPAGVGFVALSGSIAVLHALEITPTERRKGMARILVTLAADWARTQGAATLALQVTRANTAALALYSSLGLREIGQYHYRTKPMTEA